MGTSSTHEDPVGRPLTGHDFIDSKISPRHPFGLSNERAAFVFREFADRLERGDANLNDVKVLFKAKGDDFHETVLIVSFSELLNKELT